MYNIMNYIIKTSIVGDYGVGKTSLINRYVNDNFYMNEMHTLGVDFLLKEVNFKENKYKLQIWDTAGQEKFESIVNSYIRDINACILVFDVNCMRSFNRVRKWYQKVRELNENKIYVCLVGTKTDMNLREVNQKELDTFREQYSLDYVECSSKDNKNITHIFINLINRIDDMVKKDEINLRTYGDFEENKNTRIKDKCCNIS